MLWSRRFRRRGTGPWRREKKEANGGGMTAEEEAELAALMEDD